MTKVKGGIYGKTRKKEEECDFDFGRIEIPHGLVSVDLIDSRAFQLYSFLVLPEF